MSYEQRGDVSATIETCASDAIAVVTPFLAGRVRRLLEVDHSLAREWRNW